MRKERERERVSLFPSGQFAQLVVVIVVVVVVVVVLQGSRKKLAKMKYKCQR